MKTELLYGFRVLKKVSTIPAQQRLQSEYLKKSYRAYLFKNAKRNVFAKYFFLLEIFRIFLFVVTRLKIKGTENQLAYFASTQNQMRQIQYIQNHCLPDRDFLTIDMRGGATLHNRNYVFLCIRSIPLLLRYAGYLFAYDTEIDVKNNVLYLCAYSFFLSFLKKHAPSAVIVANDHSSFPLGFAGAARTLGIKTAYIQHAHVSKNLPPLRVDLAILDGESARDIYSSVGKIPSTTKIVYRGLEGEENPMKSLKAKEQKKITIGLFVNIFDYDVLQKTIDDILSHKNIQNLILREHPAFPINQSMLMLSGKVSVSEAGTSLWQDAKKCDFVLGGNSSFHISVLKFGVPCIFYDALDYIDTDYYGFVKHNILYETQDIKKINFPDISNYYNNRNWPKRFQYFDASYQKNVQKFKDNVRQTLLELM